MGSYSDTGFYTPSTKEQIQQVQYNLYNALLISIGIPEISYEQFTTSNPKLLLETVQEYDLQVDNTLGLFYSKILNYIISLSDNLQLKPYGCTTIGLDNSLMDTKGVTGVSIDEPNRQGTSIDPAYIEIAIDGTPDTNDLFQTLLYGVGCGVVTQGDKSVTGADPKGQTRTYKYSEFTQTTVMVKLFYVYNNNYYGNRPQNAEIIEKYIEHWHEVYKVGNDLLPAQFNDISVYNGLGYLDSQFSVDGGTTWLDRNAIYDSDFNEKVNLDEASITAELE